MADRARPTRGKSVRKPAWAARFEPNSYGLRLRRSGHDAMAATFTAIGQQATDILDTDLEQGCARITPDALRATLSLSPSLRCQLRAWRKAGGLDHGTLLPTETGTV